jgi:hypothetical protein
MPGMPGAYGSLMGATAATPATGGTSALRGAIGGFGKGMMDPHFRNRFEEGAFGGYQDLMSKQKVGDFVAGNPDENLMEKFQNLRAKMQGPKHAL